MTDLWWGTTSPSPAPTPTPAGGDGGAGSGSRCQPTWGQCGGQVWKGATCCTPGHICVAESEWYSQCKPVGGSSPTLAPALAPAPTFATLPPSTLAPAPAPIPAPTSASTPPPASPEWQPFAIASVMPSAGTEVRVTGFGAAGNTEVNLAQQEHSGPLSSVESGDVPNVLYHVDTTGGNSGGPVWYHDPATGRDTVVAIHTNGGCSSSNPDSNNIGNGVLNTYLQQALASF